jgi:hypothetical protein
MEGARLGLDAGGGTLARGDQNVLHVQVAHNHARLLPWLEIQLNRKLERIQSRDAVSAEVL